METEPVFLLAEDDYNDALLIQSAFRKAALPVRLHVVRGGDEAITYLSECAVSGRSPCVFMLDLVMPRVGGLEVLAWLKGQPELARMPVVVLSASIYHGDKAQALALGARDFIGKPSDRREIIALLQNLYRRYGLRPALAA